MRYLCLGYHDERAWAAMNEQDRAALVRDCVAYQNQLRSEGHYVDGKSLQGVRTATTLRFDTGGAMAVTDGPFTETKEQLGGVIIIEAADLNEAIRLMSNVPGMRVGGSVEIRPINEKI
jgi:hypothetical protein